MKRVLAFLMLPLMLLALAPPTGAAGRPRAGTPVRPASSGIMQTAPRDAAISRREGEAALARGDYASAIRCLRAALARNPADSGSILDLARAYAGAGQFQEAVSVLQDNRARFRAQGRMRAFSLGLAGVYRAWGNRRFERGEYGPALSLYRSALRLDRPYDKRRAADDLTGLGNACYSGSQQLAEVARSYEEALSLYRQVGDRASELNTLLNLAAAYGQMGRFEKASACYRAALALPEAAQDRELHSMLLNGLGATCVNLGDFDAAIANGDEALRVARDSSPKARYLALNNLASAYDEMGSYDKALADVRQALATVRDARSASRPGSADSQDARFYEGVLLVNMGKVLAHARRYDDAIRLYHEALGVQTETGNAADAGGTRRLLGSAYGTLGRHEAALACLRQALWAARHVGDRQGEGAALDGMGQEQLALGHPARAITLHTDALLIAREIRDPLGEALALRNLMLACQAAGEPRLAVFYGKQAVNTIQYVRANIRTMDPEVRHGFLAAKGDTYRILADLLVRQDRLAEAQSVLDLLKDEEYFEFVRRDASAAAAPRNVPANAREEEALQRYRAIEDRLAAIGRRYGKLRAIPVPTAAQRAEEKALRQDLEVTRVAFDHFTDGLAATLRGTPAPAGQAPAAGISPGEDARLAQIRDSQVLMSLLGTMEPGTVAIYTVVAPEAVHLIVITPETRFARTVPISAAELRERIVALTDTLRNPYTDPRDDSRKLYDVLVAPIERDLEQVGAKTLLWSLDGPLRYVPVAALYDGRHYLVERYVDVIFTPRELAYLEARDTRPWRGLGLGVTEAHEGFAPLPGARAELESIIRSDGANEGLLQGELKLDGQFTEDAMDDALRKHYPLVHIASHFQYQPGNEDQSFLLLGDGQHLSLRDIRLSPNLFGGVELLCLSACSTAVDDVDADGKEVDGFATTAELQGAHAVLATLWPVADDSTRRLMLAFYRCREASANAMKGEALRQAQLMLLHGAASQGDAAPQARRALAVASPNADGTVPFPIDPNAPFAHPYYWAPFVLTGNWH